jgi:class 3 adenylate cyclase
VTDPRARPTSSATVLRTFIGVDLVGFTAATDAHGDETAARIAACLVECTLQSLGVDDELVKTIGDGALLASPDPLRAVQLTERLQENLNAGEQPLAARIGIHSGEAVAVGSDYIGGAVNLTARLTSAARPGQVLLSAQTAAQVAGSGISLRPVDSMVFRHVHDVVELFELVPALPDGGAPALDPVCHMRLDGDRLAVTITWRGHRVGFCSELCAQRFAGAPEVYLAHLEDC